MTGFIKFEVCISFYISIFQFNLMRRIAMRCLGQNICFNNFQINFGCNFDTSKDVSALYNCIYKLSASYCKSKKRINRCISKYEYGHSFRYLVNEKIALKFWWFGTLFS